MANNPLTSYKTKLLINMFLDSGTEHFSADDIYISEETLMKEDGDYLLQEDSSKIILGG